MKMLLQCWTDMWKILRYTSATYELRMCCTCVAHVHLFVCIGALDTLEHWSIGHLDQIKDECLAGDCSGREQCLGSLHWRHHWDDQVGKKGKRNTNTSDLTKSAMYRMLTRVKKKQNLCRNQDGVLVTAPNALEQNLRRLVSKTNIIMGRWWWHFRFWVNHLWMDVASWYYKCSDGWMDGWRVLRLLK